MVQVVSSEPVSGGALRFTTKPHSRRRLSRSVITGFGPAFLQGTRDRFSEEGI
jgi:hypothetical protein